MSTTGGGGGGGGGVGGALSLMGCVREASPPPQDPPGLGDLSTQSTMDSLPKEPKRRRFHPLRGLRKIFRRKSRGAADVRLASGTGETCDLPCRDREEVTLRHPAGRPEEARSRSASELLTDSCDGENVFLRRSRADESFGKFRGGAAQLSISHDSVFPGEVPHTRPLSSLDSLATLERRQTKTSDDEHRDSTSHVVQRHRISLRVCPQVLEQIKTVIENRNQLASATSMESTSIIHTGTERYQQETTENRFVNFEKHEKVLEETQAKVTRSAKDTVEWTGSPSKEELPQLEIVSLNHTAAHHRISVRPKNRRPPKRTLCQNVVTISEATDHLDSLEPISINNASLTVESKNVSILRKSSSCLSRTSDIFEELEGKLPRKPCVVGSPSSDNLEPSVMPKTAIDHHLPEQDERNEIKPIARKLSNRVSKGSDVFEELEAKLPRRRSSSNGSSNKSPDSLEHTWFWKATADGFEKLEESEETRPFSRRLLQNPMSKSIDRVSKSSDSLETIDAVNSDDSIDQRRRGSFEFRGRRTAKAIMSKSSESFEVLEQIRGESAALVEVELQKRSSISDLNLSRGRRYRKVMSKSSESFEKLEATELVKSEPKRSSSDLNKNCWRSSKRTAASSESSDNLEVDEELENRRARSSRRIPSTSIVDIVPAEEPLEEKEEEKQRRTVPVKKSPRLQKSSESSELGSTDTLDSEKRNKSSDSTETLDSLEKDLEQDRKEEQIIDSVVDKREKNDAWSFRTTTDPANIDSTEEGKQPLISDKTYWRQSSESKENIDIHQLLAITIVTRMADNGNQRNSVIFPKKKLSSPPTSPVKQQEDNKLLFNNLLVSKNDEDLQNMLNGNISEVSTDTKSFKEKLIMFEKLGK